MAAVTKTTTAWRGPALRREHLTVKLPSHLLLALCTLVIVYPVIWMVFASFKTTSELVTNIWGPPRSLSWQNYVTAWQTAGLGRALYNSVVISLGTVALVTVLAAPAGYALAKFRFRFATALFLLLVLTMQAPVPIIPLYVMLVRLHLTDSYIGLILPLAASGLPLSIFIFRAFFQSIPHELEDAAVVDGCTRLSAFTRVVVPVSVPAIATVGILQFLHAWNEYFLPLILIRSPELRPVPLAVQVFFFEFGRTEWADIFAALTIGALPMIVVYVLLQRQFIQGLTSGAVKG